MFRAFCLTCGVFITLCGGLLSLVDRVVLSDFAVEKLQKHVLATSAVERGEPPPPPRRLPFVTGRNFDPPDWAAAGVLSLGGVTLLYTCVLPGRRRYEEEDDYDFDGEELEPFLRRRRAIRYRYRSR